MADSKQDQIATLVKFWSQTEGRDKFGKCMQYGSRGLSWIFSDQKDLAKKLLALSQNTASSRKIFRLGKSLNEWIKIQELLNRSGSADSLEQTLNLLARCSFFMYWVYDNLNILNKIKFITTNTNVAKNASRFWLLGLVFSILLELQKLRSNMRKETHLRRQLQTLESAMQMSGNSKEALSEVAEIQKELAKLHPARRSILLSVLKNCGDLIPATNGSEIPHMIIGRGYNDGLLGLGGFISAFISCYNLYGK